jgi:hypothetical protein
MASSSFPTLAQLAEKALRKQEFANLQPNDPLHDDAFRGIATICVDGKSKTYKIGDTDTDLESIQRTLSVWEEARAGFGLKDKSISIYVIYVLNAKLFLRIGFPRMTYMYGQMTPLGGHIDLSAKGPCLAAGQVMFTKPTEAFGVKAIDNQSGHYQPTEIELSGQLLRTPKTITATIFRVALGVPDIDKIYSDPEDEKRKAQRLKEGELKEKSRNLGQPMPDEEKLLAFCKEVKSKGGLTQVKTRNINPEVQTLSNIIARAKYEKQASQNSAQVQKDIREAFGKYSSLKQVILNLILKYQTPKLRHDWIVLNVPED